MIDPTEFTTREEMARLQAERLPSVMTQVLLNIRPKRAMQEAAAQDALKLAAAQVVESGREFAEVPDKEKRKIMSENYRYCVQRNTTFLRLLEEGQN